MPMGAEDKDKAGEARRRLVAARALGLAFLLD